MNRLTLILLLVWGCDEGTACGDHWRHQRDLAYDIRTCKTNACIDWHLVRAERAAIACHEAQLAEKIEEVLK